jgi:hypothetical protein
MGQDLGKQMGSLLKKENLMKFSNPNAVFKSIKRGDWGLPEKQTEPGAPPRSIFVNQAQSAGQGPTQTNTSTYGSSARKLKALQEGPSLDGGGNRSLAQSLLNEKMFKG